MNKKMENIINTSLDILELQVNEILKKTKENVGGYSKMEDNIRMLIETGCALQKLQRIIIDQRQSDKTICGVLPQFMDE